MKTLILLIVFTIGVLFTVLSIIVMIYSIYKRKIIHSLIGLLCSFFILTMTNKTYNLLQEQGKKLEITLQQNKQQLEKKPHKVADSEYTSKIVFSIIIGVEMGVLALVLDRRSI